MCPQSVRIHGINSKSTSRNEMRIKNKIKAEK